MLGGVSDRGMADVVRVPRGPRMAGSRLRSGIRAVGMEGSLGRGPPQATSGAATATVRDGASDREFGRLRRASQQRTRCSNRLDRPATNVRPGLGLGKFWPRGKNREQLTYGVQRGRQPPEVSLSLPPGA